MTCSEFFNGKCSFDPEDVDRPVDMHSIPHWDSDGSKPIIDRWTAVLAANERSVACCVAALSNVRQNPFNPFGIMR